MYFCLCCAPPTPTAGWATSEWVAGRAVEDSPFPTRIAPRRYVPPMSGQREITLLRLVGYRLVEVKELADYGLIADVFRLRCRSRHTWVRCRCSPCHSLGAGSRCSMRCASLIPSVQSWLLHNLVERCADTDKLFLCHAAICGRSVAVIYFVCFHIPMI